MEQINQAVASADMEQEHQAFEVAGMEQEHQAAEVADMQRELSTLFHMKDHTVVDSFQYMQFQEHLAALVGMLAPNNK